MISSYLYRVACTSHTSSAGYASRYCLQFNRGVGHVSSLAFPPLSTTVVPNRTDRYRLFTVKRTLLKALINIHLHSAIGVEPDRACLIFSDPIAKATSEYTRENGAAPECNGEGNGRSPRKPAGQRLRPARFPHPGVTLPGIEPGSPLVGGEQANRLATPAHAPLDFSRFTSSEQYLARLVDSTRKCLSCLRSRKVRATLCLSGARPHDAFVQAGWQDGYRALISCCEIGSRLAGWIPCSDYLLRDRKPAGRMDTEAGWQDGYRALISCCEIGSRLAGWIPCSDYLLRDRKPAGRMDTDGYRALISFCEIGSRLAGWIPCSDYLLRDRKPAGRMDTDGYRALISFCEIGSRLAGWIPCSDYLLRDRKPAGRMDTDGYRALISELRPGMTLASDAILSACAAGRAYETTEHAWDRLKTAVYNRPQAPDSLPDLIWDGTFVWKMTTRCLQACYEVSVTCTIHMEATHGTKLQEFKAGKRVGNKDYTNSRASCPFAPTSKAHRAACTYGTSRGYTILLWAERLFTIKRVRPWHSPRCVEILLMPTVLSSKGELDPGIDHDVLKSSLCALFCRQKAIRPWHSPRCVEIILMPTVLSSKGELDPGIDHDVLKSSFCPLFCRQKASELDPGIVNDVLKSSLCPLFCRQKAS
ncbi:hypothetical protein PR048_022759 [Dryococelus australis]|uniref:Uncharacterized protein n=1 Tax=Dryococelus australis TaxID=614101 RepID=A0ABQ9GSA0_9NEOP|nr:hypothetical protein PR048_022759 [Dryococelus australis]